MKTHVSKSRAQALCLRSCILNKSSAPESSDSKCRVMREAVAGEGQAGC